jgi:TonB family protein
MNAKQWFAAAVAATGAAGALASQSPLQTDDPSAGKPATVVAWDPRCAPQYPVAAVQSGAQGVTRVAVHLDEAGKVVSVDIIQRSGNTREHHMLDSEAARAISRCPFTPARDATGKAIASVVTLEQEWHVDGAQASAAGR